MSASPPLDLQAIEARLMQKIRHRSDKVLTIGCDTARDIEALLAYARALREGLQRLHTVAYEDAGATILELDIADRPDRWGLLDEACRPLRDVSTDLLHWD